MPYNPTRQQGSAAKIRRQRRLDPRHVGAGVRHSDIVAKHGPSVFASSDIQNKQETSRGWKSCLFYNSDSFEMVYEYICARNASGVVCNRNKDRAIRVLSGEVFIVISGDVIPVSAGSSFALLRGVEYQIATSGTLDAEVLFCQGPDYESDLEQLVDPQAVNSETKMLFAKTPETQARTKSNSDVTRKYAEKLQEERRQRNIAKDRAINHPEQVVEKPAPSSNDGSVVVKPSRRTPPRRVLAGQQVQGVNPRPLGAAGLGDDD
jgi:hypothetical protein